jgi:hypothetical protein
MERIYGLHRRQTEGAEGGTHKTHYHSNNCSKLSSIHLEDKVGSPAASGA